ncbi:hypothetical protein EDB82DRAFT_165192 [Fusarium venenatum]|uniref:uncharacterized protein n=1 Tax=Fusarium venenatum TaxID=56646 RepID=UPI001D3D428A|nr:hypothetical protein EDB82DRAFT_165192 [Fusarium venenatum]
MAPRRSTRIATSGSAIAPTHHHNLRKRKAQGSNEADRLKRKKKAPIRNTNGRTKSHAVANNGRVSGQPAPEDALSVLPAEIQQNILANVNDTKSMINLASTSKRYYAVAMAIIHNHIAVQVRYYAHIPKVIRLLEPHLSIIQKKQLKKVGKYKGRQERFSSRLDQDAVPGCAQDVRQMTIGSIDPGKRHKSFVLRTLEEVLKNLTNLEVLDTMELTASMASSILALKHLKALRIWGPFINIASLSQLRDLKHLSLRSMSSCFRSFTREKTLKSFVLNSSSTLESLEIHSTRWPLNIDNVREDGTLAANKDSMNESPIFTALKSLSLNSPSSERDGETCLSNIFRSVNFLQLRKLEMMQLEEGKLTFFKSLEDLFNTADEGTIQLRHLVLDMDAEQPNFLASEVHLEGIYRFIASFDTLTSLEIHNHNTFKDNLLNNPDISRRLQQVIAMHKGLESLRFRYTRTATSYASVDTLRVLTKNLPQLRVLEIPLEEKDFDGMARSILRARNLETLICSSFNSWNYRVNNAIITFREKLVGSLLHIAEDNEEFIWERVYRLKHITLAYRKFTIGSDLELTNMAYLERISRDDKSVWVQDKRILVRSKQCYYTPSREHMWITV